jgi:hypothetical protein
MRDLDEGLNLTTAGIYGSSRSKTINLEDNL